VRGTKTETRPGVWRLRVVVGYDPKTGNPRQLSKTVRGTKRTADSELARFVADAEAGNVALSAGLTVAQYLDRWLEFIEPTRQPGTFRSYQGRCRRLKADLGSLKLSKLAAHDLDYTYARWLDGGMSPATIRMHHLVLSAALHQAVRWDLLPRAVTEQARPPRVDRYRVNAPDVATVRELVARADDTNPVLSAAIMLAATTGARRGELLGLRWSDLDRERMVLNVRRAVKMAASGSHAIVGPTKTHQERRVSLDPITLALLDTHRFRVERWATDAGVDVDRDGYILTLDPTGRQPMLPDSLTQAFVRLANRCGVKLRFHDLRHFTASQLIASGHDPVVIAGRLGHTDATTTLKLYAHALEERDRQAAAVLGALMQPAPSTLT
jgi:integrase